MRSWITEGGWEYNRGTEKEGGERWKKAGVLDCKGVRWFGGGRGVLAYPPFSVDVAALCGPPRTDTPANESNLVSTSQGNSVSTSRRSAEQSTPPLIF